MKLNSVDISDSDCKKSPKDMTFLKEVRKITIHHSLEDEQHFLQNIGGPDWVERISTQT
jgi:hypothetical protein